MKIYEREDGMTAIIENGELQEVYCKDRENFINGFDFKDLMNIDTIEIGNLSYDANMIAKHIMSNIDKGQWVADRADDLCNDILDDTESAELENVLSKYGFKQIGV